MGLIQDHEGDRRPRDWGYRIAFDRKDLPSLEEMARHIRETHDTDIIEDFNLKCEQKLAGQSATLNNGLEIKGVTKTEEEDLVINIGLQQCINIILGISSIRWTHFGFTRNSGSSPPSVTNTVLDNSAGGPWYLPMITYGWMEPKGMKLFFGTITPQDTSDVAFSQSTVHEMGIAGTSATLLNRELFYNNAPSRSTSTDGEMFKNVFIFSCVIEFCPVA